MVNELDESVALITLEEARLYCLRSAGDSSRDEQLIEAINDVSEAVRDEYGREFITTTGETRLDGALTDVATAVTVESADGFPSSGSFVIKVDDELMLVTAGAGTTSLTVTRGHLDTTPAAHLDDAAVLELEARVFAYAGLGVLDLAPFDLRELERVTLYTDLDESLHDELAASAYRLTPVGGFAGSNTYLGLDLPYPAIEEASYGFGWQATVLGRGGMDRVPGSVKLGVKIWVDNLIKNPGQFASQAVNGYTVFPDVDEEGRRAGMPPASRHRFERWRRPGWGTSGAGGATGVVRFTNAGSSGAPAIPNTLPTP